MNTLILQCGIAIVHDKSFALELFQKAKSIADERSFVDEDTRLKLSAKERVFKFYGYLV